MGTIPIESFVMKKETETLRIKPFKNDPTSVWWDLKHWRVIDGKAVLCAGGIEYEEDRIHVEKYFKSKKLL